MTEPMPHLSRELPPDARDYLAQPLDGARDLYFLALALGDRPEGSPLFGRMIREARIHFAAVIEEARIAREAGYSESCGWSRGSWTERSSGAYVSTPWATRAGAVSPCA